MLWHERGASGPLAAAALFALAGLLAAAAFLRYGAWRGEDQAEELAKEADKISADGDRAGRIAWGREGPCKRIADKIDALSAALMEARRSGSDSLVRLKAFEDNVGRIQRTENFGLIASGLAHDYNNMLTAMQGNVELLLCDDISDEVRETVEDIKTAMHRSSDLVHKMLAHVCKSGPVEERIDMNGLIADLIRLVRHSLPDNAEVDFSPDGKLPVIAADGVQVWQVVMNLVVNGCDALCGRRGTVHVRTSSRMMGEGDFAPYTNAGSLKPGLYAALEVEDSGLGMDENVRKRLFTPFFTTKPTGRGLGLASVAAVVTACRGGIAVESEPGAGTVFKVIVPACLGEDGRPLYATEEPGEAGRTRQPRLKAAGESAPAAAPAAPRAQASSTSSTCPPNGRERILVVDDDTSILKLLKIILTSGGYSVAIASSGEDGLKAYEASGGKFDLALVDASMGTGMSGLDLCAAIRSRDPAIPLVLMSAYRAKEMSAKMATSGISGFLAKPFRSSDVLETIGKYSPAGQAAKGVRDGAL